jgi:pimeloyl-ACP methyl ester carboxylesterase
MGQSRGEHVSVLVRPYASVCRTGRAVSLCVSCERPLSFTPDARGDLRGPSHREGGHSALEALGIEHTHLVLHDFGGAWGLGWAASEPERLASVTLLCAGAPLGYRWHRVARIWRTPLAGELLMGTITRAGFRASLRRGGPRPLPGALVERMFNDLDHQTRRAILRLYRSVDDVAGAGRELTEVLRPLQRPALVIWGRHDPYLPSALANRQREAFPGAEVQILDESGHWPFIDQADRVEQLCVGFLAQTLAARREPELQAA